MSQQEDKKIKIGKKEYTVKKAKAYSNWFIILGIILTIISFFIMPVGIIFLIMGILSIYAGYKYNIAIKQQKFVVNFTNDESNNNDSLNTEPISANQADESTRNYVLFEDVCENDNEEKQIICYEYENNICFIDYDINNLSGNGGEDIEFKQEPQNQYDNKAVAIYLDENKIGYVYKGKIQDMINDWFRKNFFFTGYINKIFVNENKATYKIAFYKPLDTFESKTFSLIKTKKKIDDDTKREDNLQGCDEGEAVELEYEEGFCDDKETLTVFGGYYEEIGELGNGAIKYYNEHSDKKIVGIIDEIFYDDNDNIKAKIKLIITRNLE